MSTTSKLFTPLALGDDLVLKNRVVMAPMMRNRSDRQTRGPSEITELFYEQRAGAGLIIAEATAVSEQAFGWFGAAGCYNQEHVSGWKRVVDRVHARGGTIFLQLWHMGRQGHSSFNSKGELVSSSAIKLSYGTRRNAKGEDVPFEVPRALETDEIPAIVEDFRKSAALAKEAGFDGVEIHAGNGYLIDQFMQSVSNKRTDKYGGSFENRTRFLLEIVEAVKTVWPSHRIGVRITPNGKYGDMGGEDNFSSFCYVMQQLSPHQLGYLAIPDGEGYTLELHDKCRLVTPFDAKTHFRGTVMACNSYTKDTAEGVLRSGAADAVAFGRAYISNPDLAERYKNNWPLASAAPVDVYWNGDLGVEGCIMYPSYAPTQG
ncbi:hypothetical protein Poli38472_001158 [Pythium oligandrum]|uniref:NADH:flavin oxidoreductase/NADH oxidase N-terminal domain-containing protein n=1 Tax=Pythium oligandrum TaxID=41045 RepID=A0A8K1FRH5_PYTOL|nr:hypothetical protein Poli38472_001158 [Pythium oligandrum]|eukprot:TMW69002.1 hypothetical protein Poli38472_001158 [Pythium oligandrum]